MIKDLLQSEEPIVYHALENACRQHRIGNAYLFTGPKGTPKFETAILLAQSIICENGDGLACETCNTCRRIAEGKYADLVVLDGRDTTINKDMVDDLQAQFAKTALEQNGQRVYIIRNCENATVAAQNSMLKFLEEPEDGITAILTTDKVNQILPTILSRCIQIPFIPFTNEYMHSFLEEKGLNSEQIYFISNMLEDTEDLSTYYDVEEGRTSMVYQHGESMFMQLFNMDGLNANEISVDYELSWSSKEKDSAKAKQENLAMLGIFFDFCIQCAHDGLKRHHTGISWYDSIIENTKYTPDFFQNLMRIAIEQKELCNKFNDYNLVIYQTFYRLEACRNV